MANEKDINIGIHTEATGDGAKKTAADIEKLKDGSKQAAGTAKQLRKEMDGLEDPAARKELEKTAMKLDQVAYDASKAAAEAEKLARIEQRLIQESKDLERHLDKAGDAADDMGRDMTEAEQATRKLIAQQRRANDTAGKSPAAMGKAAKGKRQLGLAALEASRGIEDMQYGIRGAINNIPGLILMLGGSAGLTAAISLLAVGLSILFSNSSKADDATKKLTESLQEQTRELIKSHGASKKKAAADKEASESMDILTKQIKAQKEALDDEKSVIDAQTASLKKQIDLQSDLNKIRLEAARSQVRTDLASGAIDGDEAQARFAALDDAERESQFGANTAKIQAELTGLKSKRLANERRINEITQGELQSLESSLETANGLEEFGQERKLVARKSLEAAQEILNSLLGEKAPDLGELKNELPATVFGKAAGELKGKQGGVFRGARDLLDPVGAETRKAEDALERVQLAEAKKMFENFREVNKAATEIITQAKRQREEAQTELTQKKSTAESLGAANKGLDQNISGLEEDLDLATQKETIKRQGIELAAKEKELNQALEGAKKSLGENIDAIADGADEAHELAGNTKEELESSRKNVDAAIEALREIVADGRVQADELGEYNKAMRLVRQSISGSNKAVLGYMSAVNSESVAMRNRVNQLEQQLRTLQATNLSR